jgi:hypothetical protein
VKNIAAACAELEAFVRAAPENVRFRFADAPRSGTNEASERRTMGIEHHFLRLARTGPHEHHAAMAGPELSHGHRHAVDQDDLVVPVELEVIACLMASRRA